MKNKEYTLTMEEACKKMKSGYIVKSNHLGLEFFYAKERFVTDLNKIPFDELSKKDSDKKFMILPSMFTSVESLKKAVLDNKVIEYDYSNGFKNNYCVIDFSKPLLTDEVDTHGYDFIENDYNCIGYDSRLTNYRIKSDSDIEKDRKLDFNKSIDDEINNLQKIKTLIDEVEEKSKVVSRFFNNRNFAFRFEIIEGEIERLLELKIVV